jgi:Phosphoesterase family/Ricin-type beta-trefoil lectin domain-like
LAGGMVHEGGGTMPNLTGASITFNTHDDNKDSDTIVHVFVKNRLSTSQTPEQSSDFLSNWLAFRRYEPDGDLSDDDNNPYLATFVGIGANTTFDDPSSNNFPLALRSGTISGDDIVLPVVNIHILTNGNDRWIFDFTLEFTFDNGATTSFSSNVDGIRGIILDQDNRNYSGICTENTVRTIPLPVPIKPVTNSLLKKVTLEFATYNDNKNSDTRLNVHITNRLSATSAQDIAIGLNILPGQEFPDAGVASPQSCKQYSWTAGSADDGDGTLASDSIRLADIVLPVVSIAIYPTGNDRWIFDYEVTFEFEDPEDYAQKTLIYSSRTNGIILDQDNFKYSGVYQGRPFPQFSPPTAPPLTNAARGWTPSPKTVSLAFMASKFDEFINNRNGADTDHNPPLMRIQLNNGGSYGGTQPESYADRRAITAGRSKVFYVSGPVSLGQFSHGYYLNNINSATLSVGVDATSPTPFTFTIDFDCSGTEEMMGGGFAVPTTIDFLRFSISVRLTLDLTQGVRGDGTAPTMVDVMSWITEIANLKIEPTGTQSGTRYTGTFLKQPVDFTSADPDAINNVLVEQVIKVELVTGSALDPGGTIRHTMRDQIYSALTTPDIISKLTERDAFNSEVTSWLLGGVADDAANTDGNNTVISSIGIQDDNIVISYTGPRKIFEPATAQGSGTAGFSPSSLANIDHIVVLMMENRSFDHMLGYLSLPISQGGMGRTDVDGLKGGEFNPYRGTNLPSFPVTDSYFPLDPPHGHEPTEIAINGGRMDGFALSYATEHGSGLAGQIMGHQTGSTVQVYDALARDFAIGHRWFASHPGPTFCNRFYTLTGRLNLDPRGFWELDNSSPLRPVYTQTIFDYLSGANDPKTGQPVTWAYFEHGYCFLRFFQHHTFDNQNIFTADDPEYGFFARARAGTLPNVTFIDPHFVEYPPDVTCDGPPSDVRDGQAFVQQVANAVIAGPAWEKTMLIVIYDEHGGFYDHVPPPRAAKVSPELPVETLGVRVPAFVISPWAGQAAVFGHDGIVVQPGGGSAQAATQPAAAEPTAAQPAAAQPASVSAAQPTATAPVQTNLQGLHFDHTSVLKTITRRFMATEPPLGARYAAASDLSVVLGSEMRQPQFLPFIPYNLEFAASQQLLTVAGANPAVGTALVQEPNEGTTAPPDGTPAQDFSFEDAGDGYVYIRSHVSNLYLSVHTSEVVTSGGGLTEARAVTPEPAAPTPPGGAQLPAAHLNQPGTGVTSAETGSGVVASAPVTRSAPAPAPGPGIIQDVKYADSRFIGVLGRPGPADQRWRLSPTGVTVMQRDEFLIESEAFPSMVLQAADPAQPGSPIVLGPADGTVGLRPNRNTWHVTTRLINDQLVNAPPAI